MSDEHRLSHINTLWSVVLRAHGDDTVECKSAQEQLLERYGFAVRRYLGAALRDEAAVDEVFQEFALAFVRGDYYRVSPECGKFRNFLKTIMFRLVADYRKGFYRPDKAVGAEDQLGNQPDIPESSPLAENDDRFVAVWRESLLGRAWAKLESFEAESKKPYFAVLRLRAEFPDLKSDKLAERLSSKLNKPVSRSNARVLIHRAREKFANLLLDEIIPSMDEPTYDRQEEELIELGLIEYCRPVLLSRKEDQSS